MTNPVGISVLVPWRTDHGHRERLWRRLRPLWETSGLQLCVGEPDLQGPFNCAQALNRAAAQATGGLLVIWGADQVPDPLHILNGSEVIRSLRSWSPLYDSVGYLSENDTERVLAGEDPAAFTPERVAPACTGVLAITREAWQGIGGADERYSGWGYEDTAMRRALMRRYGDVKPPARRLIELWHPTGHQDVTEANPNRLLYEADR